MNYTLILYKSDGCNTCRGCVMEQWGSDFSLDVDVEETDAIERIALAFTAPSEGGSYEAHLIGIIESKTDKYNEGMLTPTEKVVYSFEQYGYHAYQNPVGTYSVKSYHCDTNTEEVDAEGNRLNGLIRARVSEILEQRRLESERAAAEKKEKETKQKETYERQQLEALKQKYEGTN